MAVNGLGIEATAPLVRPLREGAYDQHEVLQSSPASYISKSLAAKLNPYKSRRPAILKGVVGKIGPQIGQDVLVQFEFQARNEWSLPLDVTCGVIENGPFPGETMENHPGSPIIDPVPAENSPKKVHFADDSASFNVETVYAKNEEIDQRLNSKLDGRCRKYIHDWNTGFPGVFDATFRKTAAKAVVTHRIDTEDAAAVRQGTGSSVFHPRLFESRYWELIRGPIPSPALRAT